MSDRVEPRYKKRIPCRIAGEDGSYSGMILNLSRTGLFIQTRAGTKPGSEVSLNLAPDLQPDAIQLRTRVVWQRKATSSLTLPGGIGVEIQNEPTSYLELINTVMGNSLEPEFRVRISKEGSPRSWTMTFRCNSEEEARSLALEGMGPDEKILELAPISKLGRVN